MSDDLESDIMNQLQEKKSGQSIEQLSHNLKKPQAEILTVLEMLRKEKYVLRTNTGVWVVIRTD